MKTLENLFERACKPDPASFPNENEAAVRFIRNKFIFAVHLIILTFQIISIPFIEYRMRMHFFRLLLGLSMLGVFLLCCRTRPLFGQIINASLLNFAGLVVSNHHPERVYLSLLTAYCIPSCVFYTTQSVRLTAITSFLQISSVLLSFKANLIEALSFVDPEIFAEKWTKSFITTLIPLQVLYLIIVYILNKKTEELSKATRKAEEALEQQKTFLFSFSHEMRNPMNSLLGNLDLAMMSGEITPELKEMINTAKICGVLLLNLINTVLDAGKLGLGKLEVNPVPTKVHDVFQKVWGISHDIICKKGLKSHLKFSRQVPGKLLLDDHRLNQVLMNLIGNAIKFTETGSIMLAVNWLSMEKISEKCFQPVPYDDEDEGLFEKEYNLYAIKRTSDATADRNSNQSLILSGLVKKFSLEEIIDKKEMAAEESKGVLKIIIKDTGCGMTKEEVGKLFQKFSQVGEKTSKRQMGTGLGLFISKEIVENMGGEIRAFSKPRVGSTFIICIPMKTVLGDFQQPQQQENCARNVNSQESIIKRLKAKKLTTIVADDSSYNVSLVCNFYEKIGVRVLGTASNGGLIYEQYIELVRLKNKIDVVTLDIDMPVMNGKEVCKLIREYEKKNGLKRSFIILISGNYEEKDLGGVLSGDLMRADCFLRKPLVFEELCLALDKYQGHGEDY